ncbi:MAG: M28 family peptidase [Bacillota bacterium]
MEKTLLKKAKNHMVYLCESLTDRHVGSLQNQKAADYLLHVLNNSKASLIKEETFNCFDWEPLDVSFEVDSNEYKASISPYSPSAKIEGDLCTASNLEELRKIDGKDKIVLLTDDLTKEQLVPKNFPFYNIEEHKEIISLLENKGFKAVIAATGKDENTAGGMYPFPLIEDGDFLLPSIYIKDKTGEKLKNKVNKTAKIEINTLKEESSGKNIIVEFNNEVDKKIVLFAHFDSKLNSPGAVDNATGVTALLLLADLIGKENLNYNIEIALLNGEDYYSNPGQRLYFIEKQNELKNILLGINIDGMGYINGKTAYTTYNTQITKSAINNFSKFNMTEGEKWYQGEHAVLAQQGIPALAFTTNKLEEIMSFVHTKKDNLKIVDFEKIVDTALALKKFIYSLQ